MNLKELSSFIDGTVIGDETLVIKSLSPLNDQTEQSLSFILDNKQEKKHPEKIASAFITYKKLNNIKNQIIVKNTQSALAKAIEFYIQSKPKITEFKTQIPHSTQVSSKAEIDNSSHIGTHCKIYANSYIGSNCNIGNNVTIHPNVTIYDNTIIKDNVTIHAGTVIGADGFGYYKDGTNNIKIPHIGCVIIESNVEIGANTCIDRGCLGKTIIKQGTKIDNLTQVAHNSIIGKNTLIAAQTGITGSITIGNNVTIGGQVGIYANIEDNVFIAGKSGITKQIAKNTVVSGFPAEPHKNQLKKQAYFNKLYKENQK